MTFNLFGPPTKDDIRVGYIDPVLGLVEGVTICQANDYAIKNPGTTFIFRNGNNNIQYLNVNEVNQLDPNVLTSTDECGGINQKKECGPPVIQMFGGGGIGAAGNPIIGRDGALLAVDVVRGGNGYQYPPLVAARDNCNYGSGATLTAILGEVTETIETYENESDFEDYELCEPTDVGYGRLYGPDGEDLGPWEPKLYTDPGEDPIRKEIEDYEKIVRTLTRKPFWTSRTNNPTRISCSDPTVVPSKYDVNYWNWGGTVTVNKETGAVTQEIKDTFMNKYAISPVAPSNVVGSDFAGRVFVFEWTEEFPTDGEYIFRGICDNKAELFIDDNKVGNIEQFPIVTKASTPADGISRGFEIGPGLLSKNITKGIHKIKVSLLNVPVEETIAGQVITEERPFGSIFVREGNDYYIVIGGNDLVEIDFAFDWNDDGANGFGATRIIIPTEQKSSPVVLSRPLTQTSGITRSTGTFKADKKYGPIIFEGRVNGPVGPEIVDTGPRPEQRQQRINLFDGAGNVINARLTGITARQLSPARVTETPSVNLVSSKSWFDNPLGVALTIDAPALPLPPQEQPPVQQGRCPNNPIWSTRFPGAQETWYPVRYLGEVSRETSSNTTAEKVQVILYKEFGGVQPFYEDNQFGNYSVSVPNLSKFTQFPPFENDVTKSIQISAGIKVTLSQAGGEDLLSGKFETIEFEGPGIFDLPSNFLGVPLGLSSFKISLADPKSSGDSKTSGWSKFLNRYAISPVPPLDTPASDIGGVLFSNSWNIDIPYDGFYKFMAEYDDDGKVLLDGNLAFTFQTAQKDTWKGLGNKVKSQKVFITKGRHTIGIELENRKTESFSQINQKIFRTLDWQVASRTENQSAGSLFIKEGSGYYILIGGNDVVEIDFSFDWYDDSQFGYAVTKITIPTETGGPLVLSRPSSGTVGSSKATGTFKANKKYGPISFEWIASGSRIPEIVDSGPAAEQRQQRIIFWDSNANDTIPNAQLTAITARQLSPARVIGGLTGGTSKDGVTYEGPDILHYQDSRWGSYMNKNSISPLIPGPVSDNGRKKFTWKNVRFPENGQYDITFLADTNAKLIINGVNVLNSQGFAENPQTFKVNITQGTYDVVIDSEYPYDATGTNNQQYFSAENPTGFALEITKNVSVLQPGSGKSWKENPMGIGAILIPPPCPRKIRGRGVVTDIIVNDPGNGYLRPIPQNQGYPVTLRLKEVIVENPGINYNCGVDQIQITPSNGAELDYVCDPFGKIREVKVLNPGLGFTEYPEIRMVSPPDSPTGPTGVNASFRPVFEVVRDPIVLPERLIQVTDLVGLKQTGYIDGRPYYGSVYYDQGVRFAGFYETIGNPVRVYDTLQESITAQVTTPPSAIERSGTDITSNDPRLNIPGAPENLI